MHGNGKLQVVVADFEERSCPKDKELRNENPAYDTVRTPQCNLQIVIASVLFIY